MIYRLIIATCATVPIACDGTAPIADDTAQHSYFTKEQLQTATELRDTALKGSGAYELLADLISTAPSRLAGGPDDLKAVEWAEQTFRQLGFDRVWKQPVTLQGWARKSAVARVVSHDDIEFNVVSLGRSASTPQGGVTAPVVHFQTFEDLEAADPGTVEGRIVFISNRMEPGGVPAAYVAAVVARSRGHAVAAQMGALGLLIRSIGTSDLDHPHTGGLQFENEETAGDQFEPATHERSWAIQFGTRTVAAAALSNPDADVLQALAETGDEIEIFLDIQNENLGEITTYNVIGEITGRLRPEEIVITGGHIDAWDVGTGAMDDGMGVAVTTAAVSLIANLSQRPARTIRVVAFGAEEFGIIGGKQYAGEYGHEDHVFGSELDYGLGKVIEMIPNVAEHALPVLREISTVLEPMGIAWETSKTGYIGADLSPLAANGLRGAMLLVDPSRYFDYHHSSADTIELIEPEDIDFNTAAFAAMLYLVADWDGRFNGVRAH